MKPRRVRVKKASGEYQPFLEEKVRSSLQRAGAKETLISQILAHLQKQLYDGIPTKKIYQEVYHLLNQLKHPLSLKYNLKEAIMSLGPSGYPFEKFVAGMLAHQDYRTKTNQIIQGRCISHEIDVTAQRKNQSWMIECKFHNRPGTKSEIKDALYTYARFLDVAQAGQFNQGWLVTNTKVTTQVIKYARCVKLMILSWDYPPKESLRFLIEKSHLHPVTCLSSLNNNERKQILQGGIVFSHDLLTKDAKEKLPSALLKKARNEAQLLFKQTPS
jgi:hypothetical protein